MWVFDWNKKREVCREVFRQEVKKYGEIAGVVLRFDDWKVSKREASGKAGYYFDFVDRLKKKSKVKTFVFKENKKSFKDFTSETKFFEYKINIFSFLRLQTGFHNELKSDKNWKSEKKKKKKYTDVKSEVNDVLLQEKQAKRDFYYDSNKFLEPGSRETVEGKKMFVNENELTTQAFEKIIAINVKWNLLSL